MKPMIIAAASVALLAGTALANAQSGNVDRVPSPDAPAANQAGTLPKGAAPADTRAPSTTGSAIGNPGAGQPGKSQRDQSTTKGPVMDTPPGGGAAQAPAR